MKKIYTCVVCLSIAAFSFGQTTILKAGGSASFGGAGIGNKVVFVNFSTGQLGSTDGTVAGTIDINSAVLTNGNAVAGINNKIVFAGTDGVSGSEIWASDGTVAGTVRLMDINPGAGSSDPQGGNNGLIVVNNVAYFSASDGVGRKLYKTDGTVAGTALVKDLGRDTIAFPFNFNPV
jgi:ELWxxDGT repeat protein